MVLITLDELRKKLSQIPKDTADELEKAMDKVVLNIEGRAKDLCPFITGTLRRSISSEVKREENKVKGVVGAGVEYARAVHEGTSRRAPKPFILNAIKEKEDETVEMLGNAMIEVLKRQ